MKKETIIFPFAFLIFGFFLLAGSASAEEPTCFDPQPVCNAESWTETQYQCDSSASCGANILQRERTCERSYVWTQTCQCTDIGWDCGVCQEDQVSCNDWSAGSPLRACEDWQKCSDSGDWSGTEPICACAGECLQKSANPKLLDGENKEVSVNNVSLPVKLDWADVLHAQSYLVKTNDVVQPDFAAESATVPAACSFKSNSTNNWATAPCCSSDGTNCKPWTDVDEWNFTANFAPELIFPYDPDWTGVKGAENVSVPVTLDWCDVKEAQTYRLNLYVISGGKKVCHPWLVKTMGGKTICEPWLLEKTARERYQTEEVLYSDFPDSKMDFFTKSTEYQWQVKTCVDSYGLNCKDYSQLWSFTTAATTLLPISQFYPADDPTGKTPVGLPLVLQWDDKPGINSYYYEVTLANGGVPIAGKNTASQSLPLDYPQLALNTAYQWKVKGCWDYEAKMCEAEFGQEWRFITTGRPPQLIYPAANADQIPIPLTLDWEDVPGAGSYIFKIQGEGLSFAKVLDESEFSMAFPEFNIRQEKNYSWQVKTCAWQDAKGACGFYSDAQNFKTFRMPPPTESNPINNGFLSTNDKSVSWGTVAGAKAYQYQIKYLVLSEKEKDETCAASIGKDIFETPATTFVNSGSAELKCLGDYQWQARACLDEGCEEAGIWSGPWSFFLMEPGDIIKAGGLIPCGRAIDNPKTPWKEREPCQIKHLFLLIKIIIDFLLLKLMPIILVLLAIATAVIFYTSLGQVMTMAKVISLWKAAGIGLVILFFAWTLVNVFLGLIGFNVGVFGNWYQLPT